MVKSQEKCQRPTLTGPKALKSFIGYLEGTEKAAHTIKNYRLDILSFYAFLENKSGKPASVQINSLGAADLSRYSDYLSAAAHKTNTRRRKLLTAHRFLRYLAKRNQLDAEIPTKLPAPHKIERIPLTVDHHELIQAIEALPFDTVLDQRNRALLRLLAETACLVSELGRLRFEDIQGQELEILGKAPRKLPISTQLKRDLEDLASNQKGDPASYIFSGYNRHGRLGQSPLGQPISSRGVELLVRFYSPKISPQNILTPRVFRHSAVLAWFKSGVPQAEIQRRLGLKTVYAFRTFAPLLSNPAR